MMLEHALSYAASGFPVLPLLPKQKAPACGHGKDDATCNADVIKSWWRRNPNYNIGIRPPEGVIVLDIDPRNGGDIADLGILTPTLAARTGSGGWHIFYQCNGAVRGQLAGFNGIDIKSHTGYIVAAPSIHPEGGQYKWVSRLPVAALPTKLVDAVRPPRPKLYTSMDGVNCDALTRFVATAPEGERNRCLHWAACRAAEDGAGQDIFEQLAAAGQSIGLTGAEVQATINSARRAVS